MRARYVFIISICLLAPQIGSTDANGEPVSAGEADKIDNLSDKLWTLNEQLLEYKLSIPMNFSDGEVQKGARCVNALMDFSGHLAFGEVKSLIDVPGKLTSAEDRSILKRSIGSAMLSWLNSQNLGLAILLAKSKADDCDHSSSYLYKRDAVLNMLKEITAAFSTSPLRG